MGHLQQSGKKAQTSWEERLLAAEDPLKFIQNRLVELEHLPNRDNILTRFANVMKQVADGPDSPKKVQFQKVADALARSGEFDSVGIANAYYVGLWDKSFRDDPAETLKMFEEQDHTVRFRSSVLSDFSDMLSERDPSDPTKARLEVLKEELREELDLNPDLLKNTDPLQINRYIQEIAKDGPEKSEAIKKLMERMTPEKSALILNGVLNSTLDDTQKKHVLDTLISKDPKSIIQDHIVSRMSEMHITTNPLNNKLRDLTSTVAQAHREGGPEVSLTRLMVLANKEGMCTVRDASAESIDGQEQALAVQNYAKLEANPEKREQFAAKQLNKYVESLDVTNLNNQEKEKISKALTAIMEPICKDDKEKKGLKSSVDKLVRECAKQAGEKMSFKQAWQAHIVEPIKQLLGREKDVLKTHEKVSKTIKQSFAEKAAAKSGKSQQHSR